MNRFLAESKDLEFRSSIDPKLPPVFYADELRCRQVINNIVGNAVKYTKAGFVSLAAKLLQRDGKDWLQIEVEDSGVGIKKEDFAKLFDPFQQMDSEKNHGIQGTGLGLSITKVLTEI
jgi:signal transduction histidine kinase